MLRVLLPLIGLPLTSNSRRSIAVHELDRLHVQVRGAHIRPFNDQEGFSKNPNVPTHRGTLDFTLWELFHASKKAELLNARPAAAVVVSALASLVEHFDLFANAPQLKLRDGHASLYADFSSTSLAGRLAQGMALLFMQSRGFAYVERMEALLNRALRRRNYTPGTLAPGVIGLSSTTGLPTQDPDFIFEGRGGRNDLALAESKGSFAIPTHSPNIKGAMSDGLTQLAYWPRFLNPPPRKSFVVGTFFREECDTHAEPSMIAFVDPEGDEPTDDQRTFSEDAIRRANYAAWLRQMGFQYAANALTLQSPQEGVTASRLAVIALPTDRGNREFAFRIVAAVDEFGPTPMEWLTRDFPNHIWPSYPIRRKRPPLFLIAAIELKTLRQVEIAVSRPEAPALLDLQQISDVQISSDDGLAGSVFPDGTFFGAVSGEWLTEHGTQLEEFKL